LHCEVTGRPKVALDAGTANAKLRDHAFEAKYDVITFRLSSVASLILKGAMRFDNARAEQLATDSGRDKTNKSGVRRIFRNDLSRRMIYANGNASSFGDIIFP